MLTSTRVGVILLISLQAILIGLLATPREEPAVTGHGFAVEETEPAPPPGQTYIGMKSCSACHFEQYGVWKQDKHVKAFEILPEKYKTDPACLKCHTTGYGEESGFKTAADSHLAGTTCEACHGPGSKHQEICQEFATAKTLSPDQEKMARDSIYKLSPENSCIACHTQKAHKPHPDYDKDE